MLLRCKRYVENRVEFLSKCSEQLKECGKSSEAIDSEIESLLKILDNE